MKYVIAIVLALVLGGCSTVKVETDYNPDFDFTALNAYAVVHEVQEGEDTLTSGRIIRALDAALQERGYTRQSQETADMWVRFYTETRRQTEVDTEYRYSGLYPYYGYAPMMSMPTTRVSTYYEGILVVDIVRRGHDKIIWRGVATDRMRSFDSPQERSEYIQKIIGEMFTTFPKREMP